MVKVNSDSQNTKSFSTFVIKVTTSQNSPVLSPAEASPRAASQSREMLAGSHLLSKVVIVDGFMVYTRNWGVSYKVSAVTFCPERLATRAPPDQYSKHPKLEVQS